jgi:hypothetical protein
MEQLNAKKDSWLAWSVFVVMALALSMSLTACGGGKKKGSTGSGKTPNTPTTASPSCSNCKGYTDELAAGLNLSRKTYVDDMEVSLVVFAPSSNKDNNGPYNGPVYVEGMAKINKANYVGCQIPAGTYYIYATQAGGTYSSNYMPFNLNNIQAELVKKGDSKVKFPLTIGYVEFKSHTKRKGPDGYNYQLSFYGDMYFCNNTTVHFPYEM